MKKIFVFLLLTVTLYGQNELLKLFKYSTVYASFSLNAPRYQDDRFAITDGLSTGILEIERTEMDLDPDFQTSFGIRKIGRFNYEPKRGVKNAGRGGSWYDGTEQSANESATLGSVSGYEFLIKFSEGRRWGDYYTNQEYWLRYTANWWMAKIGYTELGLEEVEYGQGDLRFKWTPSFLSNKAHLSIGVKNRQHPVYGFDAMVLDTSWYRGTWWDFAEDAFGWDDNSWYTIDGDGNFIDSGTLVYWDPQTETYIPIPGDGPFFYGNGEFRGYDFMWQDADGNIQAWTDREFFQYHFPDLLESYIDGLKKEFGYQRETSLVLGLDFYHYDEKWWLHTWGNWLPYHYGHDKYSYNNASLYSDHLENGGEPYDFEFEESVWHDWNDYDFGVIFGIKLKDNFGVFAEGRYLYYWERPAYDIKFGINYQFLGF
jgi:hypothetical protein